MHLTSSGTLVILITSTSEFLLYFTVIFFSLKKKKKQCCRNIFFFVLSCLPYLYSRIACPVGLNCDQMEHLKGEQYSQYPVERNHGAYMSMRDYRNPPWMSAPFCSAPPTYAPPTSPSWASIPQPRKPP